MTSVLQPTYGGPNHANTNARSDLAHVTTSDAKYSGTEDSLETLVDLSDSENFALDTDNTYETYGGITNADEGSPAIFVW